MSRVLVVLALASWLVAPIARAKDPSPAQPPLQPLVPAQGAPPATTDAGPAPAADGATTGDAPRESGAPAPEKADEKDDEGAAADEKGAAGEKKLNVAAIGSIATGASGLVGSAAVLLVALLQVPNPLALPEHKAELAAAEMTYRANGDPAQLRRAQAARTEIRKVEEGLAEQVGVMVSTIATILPALVAVGIGTYQLVAEE